MELRDDGENRGSSEGRQAKGIERVEDGVNGRQAKENENMEDGGERRQARGVETKLAGLEARWRRIRRSQWCGHVLANKTYLFVS